MHASPVKAGAPHLPVAGAADEWVPAFAGTAGRTVSSLAVRRILGENVRQIAPAMEYSLEFGNVVRVGVVSSLHVIVPDFGKVGACFRRPDNRSTGRLRRMPPMLLTEEFCNIEGFSRAGLQRADTLVDLQAEPP